MDTCGSLSALRSDLQTQLSFWRSLGDSSLKIFAPTPPGRSSKMLPMSFLVEMASSCSGALSGSRAILK